MKAIQLCNIFWGDLSLWLVEKSKFPNTDIYTLNVHDTKDKSNYHCNICESLLTIHSRSVLFAGKEICIKKSLPLHPPPPLSLSLHFSRHSHSPSFFFSTLLSTSLWPNQFSFERSKVSRGAGRRFSLSHTHTRAHTHTISLLPGLSGTFTFSWFCAFCCTL